jgi:hypothetical protein
MKITPIFAVAESHSRRRLKKEKEIWGYSFHIVVTNILAYKKYQKEIVKLINQVVIEQEKKGYSQIAGSDKFKDYDIDTSVGVFDESPYSNGSQKFRSVYSSKDGENRPFNLLEGTFNDMVISGFIDEHATVYTPEEKPKISSIPTTVSPLMNDLEFNIQKYKDYTALIDWKMISQYIHYFKFQKASSNIGIPFEIFDEIVEKSGAEKYDKIKNKEMYDIPHDESKGKLGWRFLFKLANDFNPKEKEELDAKYRKIVKQMVAESTRQENKSIWDKDSEEWKLANPDLLQYTLIKSDEEAGKIVFEFLKDRLIYCNGQTFYKHENIWINDTKMILASLRVSILGMPIFKSGQLCIFPYSQDLSNADKVVKIVMDKTVVYKRDDAFYSKFHSTTKGKLCFKDGVLDFKTKQFYLWKDINFPYYSTLMINRPFADVFKNRASNKDVKEIKEKIFNALFEENCDLALAFLARGVAGHNEDKHWGKYMGNRDCGKGVFGEVNQTALEKYATTINASHFLSDRGVGEGDQAKKTVGWLIYNLFVLH